MENTKKDSVDSKQLFEAIHDVINSLKATQIFNDRSIVVSQLTKSSALLAALTNLVANKKL